MEHAWRCCVAVILGLMWYFTDCAPSVGQFVWLTGLCILCYMSAPLLFQNNSQESKNISRESSSTQSELLQEDSVDGQLSSGVPDSTPRHCSDLKKSVQKVIECAYAQYLHPLYADAEPRNDQPLYRVLSKESDFIVDQVICGAKNLDVGKTVVGSVRILTEHIRYAKHSDGEPPFNSMTLEISVLRKFAETLVRNILPRSLWGQDVICCALNEIIALNALEMVSFLSEPHNLNQLLVTYLDSSDSNQTHAPDQTVADSCEDYQIVADCYTAGSEKYTVDIDLDDYLTHMWSGNRWALSIPHAEWRNGDMVFTVHLEERDVTEDELHWDVQKTYMDVTRFRDRLQDSSNLPLISELLKGSEEMISEGVRASVERFLQEVVADDQMGHSQPVFQFLGPELNEDELDLLSGLATLLTTGQQDDELHISHVDAGNEDLPTIAEESSEASNEDCDIVSDGLCVDGWSIGGKSSRKEKHTLKDQGTLPKEDEKHFQRKASLKRHKATETIMELFKEISGNSVCLNVLNVIALIFKINDVNSLISKSIPTEENMTAYISDLCERRWPGGSPAPLKPTPPKKDAVKKQPTKEDMDNTRARARQLICDKYPLKTIFKKKKLEKVFELFQSSSENKRLVYRLLSFLLSEFLPVEDALKDALQKGKTFK